MNFQLFSFPLGWWATQLSFSKLFLPKVAPGTCYYKQVSRYSGDAADIGHLSPLLGTEMFKPHTPFGSQ